MKKCKGSQKKPHGLKNTGADLKKEQQEFCEYKGRICRKGEFWSKRVGNKVKVHNGPNWAEICYYNKPGFYSKGNRESTGGFQQGVI